MGTGHHRRFLMLRMFKYFDHSGLTLAHSWIRINTDQVDSVLGSSRSKRGGFAMAHKKSVALTLLVPAAVALFAVAYADSNEDTSGSYKRLTTISIPDLVGFDISWVDSASGRYYLADRGTGNTPPTPRIDVIDTEHNKLLAPIPLSTAGNGV